MVSLIARPSHICKRTKLAAASAEARYFGSAVNSKRCAESLRRGNVNVNKTTAWGQRLQTNLRCERAVKHKRQRWHDDARVGKQPQ